MLKGGSNHYLARTCLGFEFSLFLMGDFSTEYWIYLNLVHGGDAKVGQFQPSWHVFIEPCPLVVTLG